MGNQAKTSINPFDIVEAVAAARIAPGCLVARSASGTVAVNTGTTDEQYLGIAGDMAVDYHGDADSGFYNQYDPVPVITRGRVRVRLIGGGTDVTAGNYLQAQRNGLLAVETGGNRTLESVAKAVDAEDTEVSNFTDTGITAPSVGSLTVTCSDTSNFSDGDYVELKGDSASEIRRIKTVDSSTQVTLYSAVGAAIGANPEMNGLVPCEAVLL